MQILKLLGSKCLVVGKDRQVFARDQALSTKDFLGRGQDQCGQATKGVWGMSRRQQAKKGVEDCDKPGGAVKRALIPGCPNDRALNP